MKILKVTLLFKNEFHTTGESKGAFIDLLKDHNGVPYIPATHIKGIMRSEAERLLRKKEGIPCNITGVEVCDEVKNGKYRCDVCRIFGTPNVEGGMDFRDGKIRITQFRTEDNIIPVSRMHVSIDRDKQVNSKQALFNISSVPQGTRFTGYLFIKSELNDSENRLLYASLHSMGHYGIGKDRSRGLGGIESIDGLKISEISEDEYMEGR
ncbi:MAG: hypothetical protein IBX39_06660 [Candidatus Methanoperedenaceae archaeon]|nr:hypothetical protein [Candidatus Methanoperedenaceae archaeon]